MTPDSALHPHAVLVDRFYRAFARRDAEGMAACYTADVLFEDPAFGRLRAEQATGMWRMLCARARDLRVEADAIEADDRVGRARWQAWYTFSATGRNVHNVIHARFVFRDGLIAQHRDSFGFWRWSRQALGPAGWLLGWSPVLRSKVRAQALAGLRRYLSEPRE